MHLDPDLDARYPGARPAAVTLVCRGGRRLASTVLQPYGEPANPVSDDDLGAKFVGLVEPVLGADRTAAALQQLWNLDSLDFLDSLTDYQNQLASPEQP